MRSSGQIFCRLSLYLEFSNVPVMVRLGLCVFGRKYTEVNFIFISSYQSGFIVDVKLDHLAVVVFWGFFSVKLFSFPPSLFLPNFLIVHRYYLSNCDLEDNILTRIHNFLPTYPPNKGARYIDDLINKILKLTLCEVQCWEYWKMWG